LNLTFCAEGKKNWLSLSSTRFLRSNCRLITNLWTMNLWTFERLRLTIEKNTFSKSIQGRI
jgi:hypothetical protein